MRTSEIDRAPAQTFGLAGGCLAVVAAAFVAAAVPLGYPVARVLVLAVAVAAAAALLRDPKECAAVTVVAALVFVGFLSHHDGVLTGAAAPWRYTAVIVVAALLARLARRFLTRS